MDYIEKGAIFSEDGIYRYDIWRRWAKGGQRLNFVCLNPSTANKDRDDPTLRRCVQFAVSLGYSEVHILNLFALVTSNPEILNISDNPIGEENDDYLKELGDGAICAWGNVAHRFPGRTQYVRRLLVDPYILGLTKLGEPCHPLYLPIKTKRERW